MNCREAIDIMDDAIEGNLQPALRADFEAHIVECSPCETYLEQLILTRGAMQYMPKSAGSSPRRKELLEAFGEEFRRPKR